MQISNYLIKGVLAICPISYKAAATSFSLLPAFNQSYFCSNEDKPSYTMILNPVAWRLMKWAMVIVIKLLNLDSASHAFNCLANLLNLSLIFHFCENCLSINVENNNILQVCFQFSTLFTMYRNKNFQQLYL